MPRGKKKAESVETMKSKLVVYGESHIVLKVRNFKDLLPTLDLTSRDYTPRVLTLKEKKLGYKDDCTTEVARMCMMSDVHSRTVENYVCKLGREIMETPGGSLFTSLVMQMKFNSDSSLRYGAQDLKRQMIMHMLENVKKFDSELDILQKMNMNMDDYLKLLLNRKYLGDQGCLEIISDMLGIGIVMIQPVDTTVVVNGYNLPKDIFTMDPAASLLLQKAHAHMVVVYNGEPGPRAYFTTTESVTGKIEFKPPTQGFYGVSDDSEPEQCSIRNTRAVARKRKATAKRGEKATKRGKKSAKSDVVADISDDTAGMTFIHNREDLAGLRINVGNHDQSKDVIFGGKTCVIKVKKIPGYVVPAVESDGIHDVNVAELDVRSLMVETPTVAADNDKRNDTFTNIEDNSTSSNDTIEYNAENINTVTDNTEDISDGLQSEGAVAPVNVVPLQPTVILKPAEDGVNQALDDISQLGDQGAGIVAALPAANVVAMVTEPVKKREDTLQPARLPRLPTAVVPEVVDKVQVTVNAPEAAAVGGVKNAVKQNIVGEMQVLVNRPEAAAIGGAKNAVKRKQRHQKKQAVKKIQQLMRGDVHVDDDVGDSDFEVDTAEMRAEEDKEEAEDNEMEEDNEVEEDKKIYSMEDFVIYPYEESKVKNRHCSVCDNKMFSSHTVLRDHFRAKHCNMFYECDDCLPVKRFQNERDYRDHVSKKHTLTHEYVYECSRASCNASFRSESQLKSHITRHHPEKKYDCTSCGRSYATKYLREDHNCTAAKGKNIVYICMYCNKPFNTKDGLRHHELYTHGKKQGGEQLFICTCGKKFQSPSARSFHVSHSCQSSATATSDET